jgi:hypothetical protein
VISCSGAGAALQSRFLHEVIGGKRVVAVNLMAVLKSFSRSSGDGALVLSGAAVIDVEAWCEPSLSFSDSITPAKNLVE